MIIVNNLTRSRIGTKKLESKVLKTLKILGVLKVWHLEIYFLSPSKMARLHKKLLKKSGPTTVISVESGKNFPVGNFSGGGDVYLCPREIKKSGLGWEYFLIHGILHLCGFDHKTKKQEKEMLVKERQICDKIS